MGKHRALRKYWKKDKTLNIKHPLAMRKIQPEKEKENGDLCINTCSDRETIIKAPIVLAEKTIEIEVEALINMGETVLEIKSIDKSVHLTEYTFIPMNIESGQIEIQKGKLFLNGFIRKSIEYSTVKSISEKAIYGEVHNITVNIPFECTTEIVYTFQPIIYKNNEMEEVSENRVEIEFFNEEEREIDEKNNYTSCGWSQKKITEPIYCEFENAKIYEMSMHIDKQLLGEKFPLQYTFQTIKETLIVSLTLKILQRQPINVSTKSEIVKKYSNSNK